MAKAYWVVSYREIKDPDKLAAYAKLAGPAIEAGGGRTLARGTAVKAYEAGQLQRTVLIEFDSVEQAVKAAEPNVTRGAAGRLDGQRAVLQNGVFQVHSALANDDPVDHFHPEVGCRCKRYEIELRNDRVYVLEQESNQFDCFVRVENLQQQRLGESDHRGVRNARVDDD